MTAPYNPTTAARAHALRDLANEAARLANARRDAMASVTSPADLAYLTTYAETVESVRDRLRASPGYET
jgi:hypothetical protein